MDDVGKQTAHALAKCGFGDELLEAARCRDIRNLKSFLPGWRRRINEELHKNKSGFLQRRRLNLTIPDTFPDITLLEKYVEPVLRTGGAGIRAVGGINLSKIAALCEKYFEWGTRTIIIKRFRAFMWDACIIHVLRCAVLEQDRKESDARRVQRIITAATGVARSHELDAVGTSVTFLTRYLTANDIDRRSEAFVNKGSSFSAQDQDQRSFILGICSKRQHISTDKLVEYRLEINPTILVQLTNSGIKGTRPDVALPSGQNENWEQDGLDEDEEDARKDAKEPISTTAPIRIWCPASILVRVDPGLIREYEEKGKRKAAGEVRRDSVETQSSSTEKKTAKRKAFSVDNAIEESTAECQPSYSLKRQTNRERDLEPIKQFTRNTSGRAGNVTIFFASNVIQPL